MQMVPDWVRPCSVCNAPTNGGSWDVTDSWNPVYKHYCESCLRQTAELPEPSERIPAEARPKMIAVGTSGYNPDFYGPEIIELFRSALAEAQRAGRTEAHVNDLAVALLLTPGDRVVQLTRNLGISTEALVEQLRADARNGELRKAGAIIHQAFAEALLLGRRTVSRGDIWRRLVRDPKRSFARALLAVSNMDIRVYDGHVCAGYD